MARKKIVSKSQIILGRNIERLRLKKEITRMQLGRKINKTLQQIERYERGDFVPLPIMESIGLALGEPVQKKIIRRISFLRKLETEEAIDQEEELIELYNEAFPEDEED